MKKNLLYSLSCLAFIIMIGGAVFEHIAMVPKWAAAPPLSLSMFQGQYALKPELFWLTIHPVNLLLFIATLIMHWRSERRKNILTVLLSYVTILAITAVYFVPELMAIIKTPFSETISESLTQRAGRWELLSLVRLGSLLVLAVVLLMGLTRSQHSRSTNPSNRRRAERPALAGSI